MLWLALFAGTVSAAPAKRVVSLDYCADQYLLELLPRENILALSPDARLDFSYHRERAAGLPQVRAVAEDVIALEPALVVRSYGGGPRALYFFERAGVPVVQLPYADDLDGVRQAARTIARSLGVPGRGEELVAGFDRRLAAIESQKSRPKALYVTAGGATGGPGTLADEMLGAAGLDNFESRPGWHSLPLERLAYVDPDLIVGAFFDAATQQTAYWSVMRHPVARRLLRERPAVMLPGAWTSCGAWFLADAVEALAAAR
jgi:iron complex transport system substrate-binding protein